MTLPLAEQQRQFNGFEPLKANFIMCPNQFLDICLVHRSRGLVRLVAYLIRETYRWVDPFDVPLNTKHTLEWDDIVSKVGISRGSITATLEEGEQYHFIEIDSMNKTISLKVDDYGQPYHSTEESFVGFFSGKGNRTMVPEMFFDFIVRRETLKVIKFVGTVFRFTVGYEARNGGRRTEHPLSVRFVSKHVHMAHRHTNAAANYCVKHNYVYLVKPGDASNTAIYAPCWCIDPVALLRSETVRLIAKVQKGNQEKDIVKDIF